MSKWQFFKTFKNESGWMPILDLQVQTVNNKIIHKFYKKPVSNPLLMLENSAMPMKVKRNSLAQEGIYFQVSIFHLIWLVFDIKGISPIGVRGGGTICASTSFRSRFLHEKRVWRSKISWLFLIHYKLSENQKKIFLVFHSVLGWSRRCGHIVPPALKLHSKAPHH